MKVELQIKDDQDLRNVIKDMIKGMVVNICREELHGIITAEVEKKLPVAMEPIIRQAVGHTVTSRYIDEQIKKGMGRLVSEEVEEAIYQKALGMLQRDNKVIQEYVEKLVRNLKVKII